MSCRTGTQLLAAKWPRMHARAMQSRDRLLVQWNHAAIDADAWLVFAGNGEQTSLAMAVADPDADFSYDDQDLHFRRIGECPAHGTPFSPNR